MWRWSMASLSNIALALANGPTSATRNVTVTGTMNFDAGDVGQTYRLAITVLGEDKPGDSLPAGDAPGDDQLYQFKWGGNLLSQKPYRQITVAAAGLQAFTETRPVLGETLDEDTGTAVVGVGPG